MKHLYPLKRILVFSVLIWRVIALNAQEAPSREFIRAVQNADVSYYNDENYAVAASLYEPLFRANPDNNNLAAKLGICYLNIDGRKAEALQLLKKASENVAGTKKEYVEYGVKAPPDTRFYLAMAYHVNDSLEKAVTLFTEVRKNLTDADVFREEYIDLQIRNSRYAVEMKKKPLTIVSELFAPWLVKYPGAINPVLARNDSVFVFTVLKDGKTQIWCSYKPDRTGSWNEPVNITQQLGGFDRLYSNSITGNGNLLILFMDDGGDGNLYMSERKGATWSRIRSVGRIVNTIYWEAHGFITPDGRTIYFSSNRPGGEGELDIWRSLRASDGSWGRPENLGNVINTPYDENTPFYDPEDDALLFSSIGHISMGGYDVFRSTFRGGVWTQPVGMPYAFNNVTENLFFVLNNNTPGFIASRLDNKTNERNIYAIVAIDPADEITLAAGTITLDDGMEVNPEQARVRVNDIKARKILQEVTVESGGSFSFDIKPGDYQVFISHAGYQTDTINLSIPLYYLSKYIAFNASLVPERVYAGEFLSVKNILFGYDSAHIKDEAKPGLETLRNIMINHPELIIEVAGYTDAKGTTEYNRRLADRRAQAVIDYFTASGMPASRFVKKAFGKTDYAAVNTNLDGTDNPEGRQYNRRVTFGIQAPKTGVVIRQEVYTPEHLRQPYSMRYSIILTKTRERLSPGYFSNLITDEMLFVRLINVDDYTMYVLGTFSNRPDAVKYLGYLREKGLMDSYIVNQYDLNNESRSILLPDTSEKPAVTRRVYTIQLKATSNQLNIPSVFNGLEGIREIKAEDGLFKYVYGEYATYNQAKAAIGKLKESGYPDAFIREINVKVDE
ncbi:MAG: OmpA family protein [Bacteroidales bacterium]